MVDYCIGTKKSEIEEIGDSQYQMLVEHYKVSVLRIAQLFVNY